MPYQEALTIIAKIQPEKLADLKACLGGIGANVQQNPIMPFAKFTNVHFARFVVLDEAKDLDGQTLQPSLVFTSNVDAPLATHLDDLVDVTGAGLDQIYSHCIDYPAPEARNRQNRLRYLQAHRIENQAFYVNTIGRSVEQVRQEAQFREAIEAYLDQARSKPGWCAQNPLQIQAAIRKFVDGRPDLKWAKTLPAPPQLSWRLRQLVELVVVALGLLILLPLIVLILPVWAVLLRLHELSDIPGNAPPDSQRVRQLREQEDYVVQNPFSAVGYVKPGWFRYTTVRILLWFADLGVRHIFNHGQLAGITTIHFARWTLIDEGRRLIFCSNYDGTLESYMDDFIDKVAWGLNAVFSNGVDYPRTRWLFFDGAHDEQAFKAFLQNRQICTQVWYAAYDRLTAVNIENNAEIRKGLYATLSQQDAEAWLRRF